MFNFSAERWNLMAKILCGLSVFFILLRAGFRVHRWFYLQKAIITSATITKLIERKNSDGVILYAPVYIFKDQNGNSVKIIASTASLPPSGDAGDTIEIIYHPENPTHSIQNSFFDK